MHLLKIIKEYFYPTPKEPEPYRTWYLDENGNKTYEKPEGWVSPWGSDDYNYLSYYYSHDED